MTNLESENMVHIQTVYSMFSVVGGPRRGHGGGAGAGERSRGRGPRPPHTPRRPPGKAPFTS